MSSEAAHPSVTVEKLQNDVAQATQVAVLELQKVLLEKASKSGPGVMAISITSCESGSCNGKAL